MSPLIDMRTSKPVQASPETFAATALRGLYRDILKPDEARRLHGLMYGEPKEQDGYDTVYGSASEADAALFRYLALGLADGEALERIARTSTRYREKWDKHRSYLARSINWALDVTAAEYQRRQRKLATSVEEDAAPGATFQLLDDVEIENTAEPEWLVEGILPTDSYAVLYGESEGGKTFLALDWALCVATGTPWRGRPVKQAPVVYIGAEGWSGFKRRVRAWKKARSYVGRAGVYFISATVNVREPKTAEQLLTDMRAKLGDTAPGMIWLDTLNRHLAGGDENSSKDIGLANATAATLRAVTGATVGYNHHCRRSDEQERGHSSLRNAADTMLHLGVGDDGETRELTCSKQRDWEHFEPLTFTLRQEGDSLVIDDPRVPDPEQLTATQRKAIKALVKLYTGTPVPAGQWLTMSKLAERTFYAVRAQLLKSAKWVTQPSSRGGYVPTATAIATAERTARSTATPTATAATAKGLRSAPAAVGKNSSTTEEPDLPF